MKLLGVGPAGQSSDRIELPQQAAYELVPIILRAQLIEAPEDSDQCRISISDGPSREGFFLAGQLFPMPEELLTIEVGR
ncbi:MAG: hypothetical protein ABIS06_08455 [Vicinamibacterales bacterium]